MVFGVAGVAGAVVVGAGGGDALLVAGGVVFA
jgi:hypothetical protein